MNNSTNTVHCLWTANSDRKANGCGLGIVLAFVSFTSGASAELPKMPSWPEFPSGSSASKSLEKAFGTAQEDISEFSVSNCCSTGQCLGQMEPAHAEPIISTTELANSSPSTSGEFSGNRLLNAELRDPCALPATLVDIGSMEDEPNIDGPTTRSGTSIAASETTDPEFRPETLDKPPAAVLTDAESVDNDLSDEPPEFLAEIATEESQEDDSGLSTEAGKTPETTDPAQAPGELTSTGENAIARIGGRSESDPVSTGQSELLKKSGLLARQSEINQSILLMERQLKQAELVGKLMALLGPETPIEIAPGEFKVFSDTPVGRRITAEMEEAELASRQRIRELEAGLALANARMPIPPNLEQILPQSNQLNAVEQQEVIQPWPEISVREIYGLEDSLIAILQVDESRARVSEGRVLPGGLTVSAIALDGVTVERSGELRTYDLIH